MGLAFEHARAVGARASEQKLVEWWGSHANGALPVKEHRNHCERNNLPPPPPYPQIGLQLMKKLIIHQKSRFFNLKMKKN